MNAQDNGFGDAALAAAARAAEAYCRRHGLRLVTAESCTGGWIAKSLTDLAGSSEWFAGGVVSYSNTLKSELLGVDPHLLRMHGAVSEAVARAMASGALARLGGDCAVAVTGIAGPGGGSTDKPAGTVWLAWAARGRNVRTELQRFGGDREAVRRATVLRALRGIAGDG